MKEIIKNNRFYLLVYLFSFLIATCYLFSYTKENGFLIINLNHHPLLDRLFFVFTSFGNGWMYIPFVLLFTVLNTRQAFILLVAFAIHTIIVQVLKLAIFPDFNRPALFFQGLYEIHTVYGVKNFYFNSFPSGHTATAFALYTLIAFFVNRWWWSVVMLLFAWMVGYSRIYLAQHFPIDVYWGSIIGITTAIIAYWIGNTPMIKKWKWLDFKILK